MPDDIDLVKVGIEATTSEAIRPFRELLEKITGPAAEEAGLAFRDSVRAWRFRRQLRLLKKVEESITKTGKPIRSVPMTLLLRAYERAATEENDDLQDRWACLLAEAATSDRPNPFLRTFGEILSQLSPMDAGFLEALLTHLNAEHRADPRRHAKSWVPLGDKGRVADIFLKVNNLWTEGGRDMYTNYAATSIMNLERLGLLRLGSVPKDYALGDPDLNLDGERGRLYFFTGLGLEFMDACSPSLQAGGSSYHNHLRP